jgi:DNA invertase Pin-like site-specific DNA recombinase
MRAVGYARISKDDTLEGRGAARQTEDIAAVCDREGWQLTEVLTDNDVSASRYSRKPRPGFSRLVDLIDNGAVDRAVVYDVDRLLRQPRQLEDLIDLCEKRNGAFQLHNVNGEMDLVTSSGRFVARMLVAKAAMESDDLSRSLRRSFDQKAAEGRPHGARAFGYEPDGMTIRDSEAALFRQAAADILAGASLNEIAKRWNDLGVRTPQRHRQWDGSVVKVTLTGPRHAGLRVHRGEVIGLVPGWPAGSRSCRHCGVGLRSRPWASTAPAGSTTPTSTSPGTSASSTCRLAPTRARSGGWRATWSGRCCPATGRCGSSGS